MLIRLKADLAHVRGNFGQKIVLRRKRQQGRESPQFHFWHKSFDTLFKGKWALFGGL